MSELPTGNNGASNGWRRIDLPGTFLESEEVLWPVVWRVLTTVLAAAAAGKVVLHAAAQVTGIDLERFDSARPRRLRRPNVRGRERRGEKAAAPRGERKRAMGPYVRERIGRKEEGKRR